MTRVPDNVINPSFRPARRPSHPPPGRISTDLPVHGTGRLPFRPGGDRHGHGSSHALDDLSTSRDASDASFEHDLVASPTSALRTHGSRRDPDVARENGFQGLIPLDDIRSEYAAPDLSQASSVPSQPPAVEAFPDLHPSSRVPTGPASSRSASLDEAPTRSSNPSYTSVPRRMRGSTNRSPASSILSADSSEARPPNAPDGLPRDDEVMSSGLPDDDGMRLLRLKMHEIRDMAMTSEDKAMKMHALMTADYQRFRSLQKKPPEQEPDFRRSPPPPDAADLGRPDSRGSAGDGLDEDDSLLYVTAEDMEPTYNYLPAEAEAKDGAEAYDDGVDDEEDEPIFGCRHYMRNVKIQCVDCFKWYTCRHCHDEVEDHALIRKNVRNMLCMHCGHAQRAAEACSECGEEAAHHYCDICKLWDNDAGKSIYHCPDCGICRKGEGIGKDYIHCKKCNVCVSINHAFDHRCVERATECNCPICDEWMFSSSEAVVAMRCGHYIHRTCYDEYMKTSYKCPICSRSAVNMETQWRKMDLCLEAQPMPESYQNTKAWVVCNDCTMRSCGPFHWLGNKCRMCDSYNTNQLKLVDEPPAETVEGLLNEEVRAARAVERAQAEGVLPDDLPPNVLPQAAEDARSPPQSATAVPPPDQAPVAASADAQDPLHAGGHARSRSNPEADASFPQVTSFATSRPSQPIPIAPHAFAHPRADIEAMTHTADSSAAPSAAHSRAATEDGESEDESGFWGGGIRAAEFMPHMPSMPAMPRVPTMPAMAMPSMPNMPNMPNGWPSARFFSTSPPAQPRQTRSAGSAADIPAPPPSRWALNPAQWRFGTPNFFSPAHGDDDDEAVEDVSASPPPSWHPSQWRLGSPRFLQGQALADANADEDVGGPAAAPGTSPGWPVDPRQWRLGSPTFFFGGAAERAKASSSSSSPASDGSRSRGGGGGASPTGTATGPEPASWSVRRNFLGRLGSFSSAAAKSTSTTREDAHDGDFDEEAERSDVSDDEDTDRAEEDEDDDEDDEDEGGVDLDLFGHR